MYKGGLCSSYSLLSHALYYKDYAYVMARALGIVRLVQQEQSEQEDEHGHEWD